MKQIPLLYRLVATGFGSGYSPVAPGTAGSLLAWLLWLVAALTLSPDVCRMLMAVCVVFFTLVGIPSATACARRWGRDPQRVVVDEMVGTWLSLLAVDMGPWWWAWGLLALLLFRLFDIFKPLGIRYLEEWPGGWGIMADDLLAGAYSAALLLLLGVLL